MTPSALTIPEDLKASWAPSTGCHRIGRWLLLLGLRRWVSDDVRAGLPGPLAEFIGAIEGHRLAFAKAARGFSAKYQECYWIMFLAAPLAVLCAASGTAWGGEHVLAGIESLLMFLTITMFFLVRKRRLRDKWLRARRTAEYLRYLPLLAPFVHDLRENWYEQLASRHGPVILPEEEINRVCRWIADQGLAPKISLEDPVLYAAYRQHLEAVLREQIDYHDRRAREELTLTHRLDRASAVCFGTAVAATVLIFCEPFTTEYVWSEWLPTPRFLRVLATVLPAIGASARGLLAQSESHRMAALSEGLSQQLGTFLAEIEHLPQTLKSPQDVDGVELLVWKVMQELISEADTWMRLQSTVPIAIGG